jgi:hypothetical protein
MYASFLVGKPLGKTPLGGLKRSWEDNNKANLKDTNGGA